MSLRSLCGVQARVLTHDILDFAGWQAFVASNAAGAIPVKTMLLQGKGNVVLLTLPADQRADLKAVCTVAGVKAGTLRVNADNVESLLNVAPTSLSLLAVTSATESLESKMKCFLDASILSNPGAEVAMVDPTATGSTAVILVQTLLDALKVPFPSGVTPVDFAAAAAAPPAEAAPKKAVKKDDKKKPVEGETRLGLEATKEGNFTEWYSQVITKSDMIEYYPVSGCYILRPWAFQIWDEIKTWFDRQIRADGVSNAYFPMFVSKSVLEREKDHVEGFAPEVAWVTKSGDSDLKEPIAIRPTSETVMYPSYAKWIRSHRDLPLRLNQWCNVVRWEFSHPTPFIRTREFLWQEGHTAFATFEEAKTEMRWALDLYKGVYEDLLAVPVMPGTKTEKERFAGGLITTTCETFVPTTGRGCQGATSHCLGQNFAKMFDIQYEDDRKTKQYVWQNSWGITTRTIGIMIMVHGDDKGLVLPPRVATHQIVIVPCGITAKTTEEQKQQLLDAAKGLARELNLAGVRAHADLRMHETPGWRYNYWELRGVPLRIELGPEELKSDAFTVCRRDNFEKETLPKSDVVNATRNLLDRVHTDMLERARKVQKERTVRLTEWTNFVKVLNERCVILAPWCGQTACEDEVKKVSGDESKALMADADEEDERAPSMGAKALCMPFDQPTDAAEHTCIAPSCNARATTYVLFGRSY